MNVVWEGETLQDTEMMEKLDSEDEVSITRYQQFICQDDSYF